MGSFDASLFSIQHESTYGDWLDLDDNGNPIRLDANKYALSVEDELCFKCTLPDCKENSVKCLINISKKRSAACKSCALPVCNDQSPKCVINVLMAKSGNI